MDHFLTRRRLLQSALPLAFAPWRAGYALAAGTQGWKRVVAGGFTSRNNSFAPWTAEFRDHLYISTLANAAGEIYSKSHKLGGEIWRSADGIEWQPIGPPGLGNPQSSTFQLVAYADRLYALSNTINDGGAEIWVSKDGTGFEQLLTGGFGDHANNWLQGFVLGQRLIVAVAGAAVGPHFQVSDDGVHFLAAASPGLAGGGNTGVSFPGVPPVFRGQVYVGTSNPSAGGELWRSTDGLEWERVAAEGLARRTNTSLTPWLVYGDYLYVIGVSVGSLVKMAGLEVYRSTDGEKWETVVRDGFSQGPERNVTGALVQFGGHLYLTANAMDPRVLVPGHPQERHSPAGLQLWSAADGVSWQKVGEDGFGRATALYGAFDVIGTQAYLTAFDYRKGTRILQSGDGKQWDVIFEEPDPSMFGEGGGVTAFGGHLYWFDNDLERGLEIWRREVPDSP